MNTRRNIKRIVHNVIQEELTRGRLNEATDEGLANWWNNSWGRKRLGDRTYNYYDDEEERGNIRLSTYDDDKFKMGNNSAWMKNDSRLYDKADPKFCGNPNSVYAAARKLGASRSKSYIELLQDIRKKLVYYLNYGYFGEQFKVLEGVKEYIRLLGYLQMQYVNIHKAAFTRHKKNGDHKMLDEGIGDFFRNVKDQINYKNTNNLGVRQKVKDNSGHKYAIQSDYKGQWMSDLAAEISELEQYGFLTGKDSLKAHTKMIEFLTIAKRGGKGAIIPLLALTTIIAGLAVSTCVGPKDQPTPDQDPQPDKPNTEVVTPNAPTSADAGTFKSPTIDIDDPKLCDVLNNAPQGSTFELLNPNDHTTDSRYNPRTAPQINKRLANQRIAQLKSQTARMGRGDLNFVFNGNLTNSDRGQIRIVGGNQQGMTQVSPSYQGTATNLMNHIN